MTYKEKILGLMHFLDRELQATIKCQRFTIDDYEEVDTWDEDKCARIWNAFFIYGNNVGWYSDISTDPFCVDQKCTTCKYRRRYRMRKSNCLVDENSPYMEIFRHIKNDVPKYNKYLQLVEIIGAKKVEAFVIELNKEKIIKLEEKP